MKVKTKENIATKENLTNKKRWFNGTKTFSSVKIEPVQIEQKPPDLGIQIKEVVDIADLFGRR